MSLDVISSHTICKNLGHTTLTGLAPFVHTYLRHWSGSRAGPGLYLSHCMVSTYIHLIPGQVLLVSLSLVGIRTAIHRPLTGRVAVGRGQQLRQGVGGRDPAVGVDDVVGDAVRVGVVAGHGIAEQGAGAEQRRRG